MYFPREEVGPLGSGKLYIRNNDRNLTLTEIINSKQKEVFELFKTIYGTKAFIHQNEPGKRNLVGSATKRSASFLYIILRFPLIAHSDLALLFTYISTFF